MSITAIMLPDSEENTFLDADGSRLQMLPNLGTVNVFVGANNSGKSRLLRLLAEKPTGIQTPDYTPESLRKELAKARIGLKNIFRLYRASAMVNGITAAFLDDVEFPDFLPAFGQPLERILNAIQTLASQRGATVGSRQESGRGGTVANERMLNEIGELVAELQRLTASLPENASKYFPTERIYLPVIRGARPLADGEVFPRELRTRKDYGLQGVTLSTGERLYREIRDMLLGNKNERDKVREFERFLSQKLFQGTDVTLIPRRDQDVLVVKLGTAPERPLSELGDGIQALIVLTYPVFSNRNAWIFIEEPELFLHPGLQRLLIETLLSHPENRYFLTTHSNHVLDMSLDYPGLAIYSLRQRTVEFRESGESKIEHQVIQLDRGDSSALQLLGVRNSSVFLVNATIWVEGITDRWYFRKLLELHQQVERTSFLAREDIHFAFVEYGGANVVHFSFLEDKEEHPINVDRICSQALVIVDNDGDAKRARIEEMRRVLGDRLIELPVREIENLLPPTTITKVIEEYEKRSLQGHTALADYGSNYLGSHIDAWLGSTKTRSYAAPSGTLRDKRNFCTRALAHLDSASYAELSSETRQLLARIHGFIAGQNSDRHVPTV